MTTTKLLRAASIIALVIAAGHSLGGRKDWSPMGANDVLSIMRSVRFQAMGVNRSYLDFYRGFGWTISVTMLLQSVVLWQLGSLAPTQSAAFRPLIMAFAVAALATAMISWHFMFPMPAILSVLLLITLLWSYASVR